MPPFLIAFNADRHQPSHGCEDDRCVEIGIRPFVRVASPAAAERPRELLRRRVPWPREGVNAAAFPKRDLCDDMRRRSEAIDAEPLSGAGHFQRAVSDETGTEERRRLRIAIKSGIGKEKAASATT